MRISTKLASARPDELPGSLRQNFVNVLQSPWAEHTMQGMIRPGCLNLILEALEPVRCMLVHRRSICDHEGAHASS